MDASGKYKKNPAKQLTCAIQFAERKGRRSRERSNRGIFAKLRGETDFVKKFTNSTCLHFGA
jgi:hypothetical protein